MKRRPLTLLAAALPLALAACRSTPAVPPAATGDEAGVLTDLHTGAALSVAGWLPTALACDVLLLGELHDAPAHHRWRARLLAACPAGTPVVLEHLPLGARLAPVPRDDDALLVALQAAGFEPAAWGWPAHAPIVRAAAQAGLPLLGGNLSRAQAMAIARQGAVALPPSLAAALAAAPLGAEAARTLDAALVAGHCGQLGASRLPTMALAQRARDAAMAEAVLAARAARPGPIVLLCGNGHARLDHGVPVLLRAAAPRLRLISVGLGEPGDAPGPEAHDAWWCGPATPREDPCAGLRTGAGP